jgi:hypothetical protein
VRDDASWIVQRKPTTPLAVPKVALELWHEGDEADWKLTGEPVSEAGELVMDRLEKPSDRKP